MERSGDIPQQPWGLLELKNLSQQFKKIDFKKHLTAHHLYGYGGRNVAVTHPPIRRDL